MTSRCSGNHSKTSLSVCLSLAVFCFDASYVTGSRCARRFRLNELSDWQDLTARCRLFQRSTREGYTCFEYVYPWPRQTNLIVPRLGTAWGSVCVYKLDIYSRASFLRALYMNKPLLYSSCICRLIIRISFNIWSVVTVVSGQINFTALLCKEFNLFSRASLHPSHSTDA